MEPGNLELINYSQRCEELRADLPTLPSTLAQERQINPYLRPRLPGVIQAAHSCNDAIRDEAVGVFAATGP